MPNMMVTEVFKSISHGLFGSCIMRTVPLEAGIGEGELPLANEAIRTLFSIDSGRFYRAAWESVYWQWFMELKFREVRERGRVLLWSQVHGLQCPGIGSLVVC